MNTLLYGLFTAGMVFLPFSTPAGDGSAVIAWGLPMLGLAAGIYLAWRVRSPQVPRENLLPAVAAFLLAVALVVATLNSPFPVPSLARLVPNVVGAVLFCYLISDLFRAAVRTDGAYAALVRVYVASATIVGAYFIATFLAGVATVGLAGVFVDRVVGGVISLPWGATNVIASTMLMPIMLTYGMKGRLPGAARVIMMSAIALTISRGAIGAMLAGMVVLALLSAPSRRRVATDAFLGLVILVAADVWSGGLLREQIFGAFLDRLNAVDLATLNDRTLLWQLYADVIRTHPLLGVGYFASVLLYGNSGHNLILTTLVERGVIGFIMSSAVLVLAGWTAVTNWSAAGTPAARLLTSALLAGGAASLLHLMVEDANATQQYMIYSWIALALPLIWLRQVRGAAHLTTEAGAHA